MLFHIIIFAVTFKSVEFLLEAKKNKNQSKSMKRKTIFLIVTIYLFNGFD